MKTQDAILFEVGMQVTWIDQIQNDDHAQLLTDEQIKESVSDRRKEIGMAADRVYTSSVRLLEKLKQMYGTGPFTVIGVCTKFVSNDTAHPQHVRINCNGNSQFSGYWLKLA